MRDAQVHLDEKSMGKQQNHPVRTFVQRSYIGVAGFFVCCVLVQVFLAGAGLLVDGAWMPFHQIFGSIIILIPLVFLLPLSIFGRFPRSIIWLTLLLAVLSLLQPILIGRSMGLVKALHPVNALFVFVLPIFLSYRAGRSMRASQE
jgi:hypothetical protein